MGAEPERRTLYQRLEELSTNFIASATSAQELSERFEYVLRSYILPAFAYVETSFERKPISTVFGLVFLTLSLVPLLMYATVCCATLSTYLVVGLLSVLLISIGTLVTLSTILASVLFGIGVATIFITGTIVSGYLVLRLALLVRQDGVAGAAAWFSDIRNYILGLLSGILDSSARTAYPQPPSDVTLTWRTPVEPSLKEAAPSGLDDHGPEVFPSGEGTS